MFDYARVQVVSSNGLMMLTHEKDPSNNLLPFFDLSFFASSNTAFDRTSGRESHRSQRFFELHCPLGGEVLWKPRRRSTRR